MQPANSALTQNIGIGLPFDNSDCSSARQPSASAGFPLGEAVAKRGRPRKDGARKPCGRLREVKDRGSELALAHRVAMVGTRNAVDLRAGYPLGILYLRGELDRAEHDAGLMFAGTRAIVYGSPTPRSHLAEFVESICGPGSLFGADRREEQDAKASRRLREATGYILIDGRRPLDVLQNVAVLDADGSTYGPECCLGRGDYEALKAALDRLVRLWKIPRDESVTLPNEHKRF